jgi:electron transfer flavoprotein alpha/beta subunit
LTAGIIIAPDDVFAIEDAVKIREDDKSMLVITCKIQNKKN